MSLIWSLTFRVASSKADIPDWNMRKTTVRAKSPFIFRLPFERMTDWLGTSHAESKMMPSDPTFVKTVKMKRKVRIRTKKAVTTQKYWPSLSITVKAKTRPKTSKIPRNDKRSSKVTIIHKRRKPPFLVMLQLFFKARPNGKSSTTRLGTV